ncbi:hypothetical protein L195_g004542 [Trifolium pratense]|uniref:Uncharacterized protein n=1 Tax=Trifolium pratense TaxID=57577 RepID=A0A2K3NYB6_TRIPR|nr:hypothetical protein L195_g004542 [Trifolium pratense]
MSSEASSSGGIDLSTQSSSTSSLVNVPIVSSPTISNVHDIIPTMPITTIAIPSMAAGHGRLKLSSGFNPMYGPPPTLGLGMPVFEPDRYTSSRVTSTPLTIASVLSLRQQMDDSNHEMVNLLTQQIVVMVRRNQDADEVVREVQNNNLLGQNNLTNMVETILAQNGLNTGCRRPNFVSAFNEYVLQTELPRGWKVPKYTKFAGDTSESTVEHIARCFTQVPEHELVEMAAGGLDYSIRKKLDTQYLRDMSQLADRVRQIEIARLKYADKAKPPMKVDTDPLPTADATYVEMAAGGLDYSIRKKLDTQYLRDMSQLVDRVRQIEVYDCNMVEIVDAAAQIEGANSRILK